MKLICTLLIAGMLGCASTGFAQPHESEHFRITKSVLDAGGGASTSTNFQLVSAFGQPTPVGLQSSEHFIVSAGFLAPTFEVAPLSPIQDLVIRRQPASTNMKLDWGAIVGATSYSIYRGTTALFTPAPENLIGTNTTNTFTDIGAVGLPTIKYFYIVTSSAGNDRAAAKQEGNLKQVTQDQQLKY